MRLLRFIAGDGAEIEARLGLKQTTRPRDRGVRPGDAGESKSGSIAAAKRRAANEERKEALMDAKYNRLIDSVAVRLTLNTVALVIWIAVSVGLLELAVKV